MSEPAPTELGRFLRARREGVRPADVGLLPGTGSRRTPGLRREELATLVGELLVKSPDFGRLWGRYEVRRAGDGEKVFRHPAVGTITLAHEILDLNRADGQRLVVYMAPQGTPDHDAMVLLDRVGLEAAAQVT